jgi:hypothetical protein
MITLSPPVDKAPFKRITLHSSGTTYFPNFESGGIVKVETEEEARELESENWSRDQASAKSAKFESDLLFKSFAAQRRRMPGVGGDFEQDRRHNDMQLAEFNVRIAGERIRVRRGDKAVTIAGIEVPTAELAPTVRRQLEIAGAKLDGASFDIDADLVDLQEARQAIAAAVVAVTQDQAFRDRLLISGTRTK